MPRRRTARRALLWGVAAVVGAHLGLAVAVETVLPQLRDPESGYRHVRARARQRMHPDRPLVVVLGTSRTQNAIDPSAMGFPDEPGSPLVFNFGQSGACAAHMRTALRRLRADGVRPAAVLVELFSAALAEPGSLDHLFADRAGRLTFADLHQLEPYLADPAALRRRWAATRANSWYAHRSVILDHLDPEWDLPEYRVAPQWLEMDRLGFRPYRMRAGADECRAAKLARMRAAHESNLRAAHVSETADRAYRDLIADCRATGTPVAFFFAPESPEFRSWYAPQWRAALVAYAHTLSDSLGCPVFAAPEDYAEEDFADGHHMLRSAAARYSRWLADVNLKPWLGCAR